MPNNVLYCVEWVPTVGASRGVQVSGFVQGDPGPSGACLDLPECIAIVEAKWLALVALAGACLPFVAAVLVLAVVLPGLPVHAGGGAVIYFGELHGFPSGVLSC